MPESYTRSRARMRTDYSGDRGYTPRPRGGGNALMFVLAGVIVVGLLVGVGFVFKDTIAEWLGGGTPAPTQSPTPISTLEPTAIPTPDATASLAPTVEPTTTPEAAATPETAAQEATISVVGDMFFDDPELADAKGDSGDYDFTPFLANIKDSFANSNLTIGTLETTLMGTDKKYDGSPKYNTPDSILDALKGAGFGIINTAHTHIFDYGYAGMARTLEKINGANLQSVGTYTNTDDYHHPLIVPAGGMQIGVLSYCEKEKYASSVPAANMRYAIKHISLESIKKGIEEAKTGGAQIIIVMLHWDKYTMTKPTSEMKTLAKKILESGADVVLGTGPKYVQPIELVEVTRSDGTKFTGLVAYSLGNFISSETGAKEDSGLILNLTFKLDNGIAAIAETSYVPTYMYSKSSRGYTVLPSGKYKDSPELLDTLSSSGKGRVPKAYAETVAAIANDTIKPKPE